MLAELHVHAVAGDAGTRRASLPALAEAEQTADPTAEDTAPAQGFGMLHLTGAQLAARQGCAGQADDHLTEARDLAAHTGEANHWNYHFGPANVAAWSLSIAVELERCPAVAERLDTTPDTFAALDSADRRAGFHLDLSRAYAQAEGDRDADATATWTPPTASRPVRSPRWLGAGTRPRDRTARDERGATDRRRSGYPGCASGDEPRGTQRPSGCCDASGSPW